MYTVSVLCTGNLAASLYKFFIGNTLKETALRVIITSVFAAITAHLAHSFRNLLDPLTGGQQKEVPRVAQLGVHW